MLHKHTMCLPALHAPCPGRHAVKWTSGIPHTQPAARSTAQARLRPSRCTACPGQACNTRRPGPPGRADQTLALSRLRRRVRSKAHALAELAARALLLVVARGLLASALLGAPCRRPRGGQLSSGLCGARRGHCGRGSAQRRRRLNVHGVGRCGGSLRLTAALICVVVGHLAVWCPSLSVQLCKILQAVDLHLLCIRTSL